ncbi:S-layer homology domain-containing protein [Sporosarcina thermotolerans]|uniref:S-layer homology domain-containing protein n=1 Tax=Sporosarcina thermotolerans TaxID=633404 RepID=A0AAW9AAS8_9BACL|nr:S-layer homology domain-containing protein [Sporosarcina thermotolerans]MDW0117495.1 S-layer homology domain-containing protein [Sporosarcina thermotolerans]WHT49664.1 S-layer homology domain-containing protein [Sporosarcina thermotolerans]
MTKRIVKILIGILLFLSINAAMVIAEPGTAPSTNPTPTPKPNNFLPFENKEAGRNSNAYMPTYNPSMNDRVNFINEISNYAKEVSAKWGIPASAIIGMAVIESGYGTTRIAVNANNIFGIKIWVTNPNKGWQLKGQPDENNGTVPVLSDFGVDRIIYDETNRVDNWYRMFSSRKEAVDYLGGTFLLNKRYGFAKTNYENNLNKGWNYERASKQYIYDIATAGYNHLGGDYYRNAVGKIMDEWNLYEHDERTFKDIHGHWAQKEIEFLSENGWIDGFNDGTFKPNDSLTRAQAAKIIGNFLGLTKTTEPIHFKDVPTSFWGHDSVVLVAQHKLMNGTGSDYFSPKMDATRAQMAQIFYNAGFYSEPAANNLKSFSDVRKDYWAYIAIETMRQEGIMAGFGDGRFGINDPISRAQLAAVIYRLDQKGWNKKQTLH